MSSKNTTSLKSSSVIAPDRIFYWAYGSNLSVRQMRRRCPKAIKWGPMSVNDCALVFRFHADVTIREGSVTPGGLWQVTAECERALDDYEGVSTKSYLKRYFRIDVEDKKYTCLFYQMATSRGVLPPSENYLDTLTEGYKDFKLDTTALEAALQESWGSKDVTEGMRRRHSRNGEPRLARVMPNDPLALLEHTPSHLLPPMFAEEPELNGDGEEEGR